MKAINKRQGTKLKMDASLHGMTLKDNEAAKVKLSKTQGKALDKIIAKRMEPGGRK